MSALTKYFEEVDIPELEKEMLEKAYSKVLGLVRTGVLNSLDENHVPEDDIFVMLVTLSLVEVAQELKNKVEERKVC